MLPLALWNGIVNCLAGRGLQSCEMEEGVAVMVELCCNDSSSKSETKTLSLLSFPTTFGAIKEKVEESCSVPACVQTVWYQSEEVSDNCNPASLYMRSGDLVRITFPQVGECHLLRTVIEWLKQVVFLLERFVAEDANGIEAMYHNHWDVLGDDDSANTLSTKLFCPHTSKTKQVNCSHFQALGGIEHLMALHKLAIKLRDRTDSENAKSLSTFYELICSQTITNLAMDKNCRLHLIKGGGLDQSIASFLIKPADDYSLAFNNSFEIVDMALYAVCNISETPEVQLWISERSAVIYQALAVAKSSRYTCNTATMAVSLLLCLAQCLEAHVNLLKPDIIDKLTEACSLRRVRTVLSQMDDVMALECYTAVVIAQLVCGSASLLQRFPQQSLENIFSLMKKVLTYDPDTIREYEISQGLVWGTFLPYISFLYAPRPEGISISGTLKISNLHHCACNVLLHCLENTLGRESHVAIVIEEGLLDYLVALTWIVPGERIKNVVREVAKFRQLQPPSLTSLAKAKLAKSQWGLTKLIEVQTISQLLSSYHVLQN